MQRLWRAYVLSNVHIALCAVIFCYAGHKLLEVAINPWVLIFLFTGSLCTYTLHRIISGNKLSGVHSGHERFSFVRKIGNWKIRYITLLIIISLFSFSMLPQALRLYLAGLSILSIAYIIPLLRTEKRLRDVSLLKIFLVAIVWAGIFITPLFETDDIVKSPRYLLLFVEKFFFIFALTLPFDIRDRAIDKESQISTFANILTIPQIKFLIVALICISCILTITLYCIGIYSLILMLLLFGFYGIQAILSMRISSATSELYYLGILDGMIMVQGFIIILL